MADLIGGSSRAVALFGSSTSSSDAGGGGADRAGGSAVKPGGSSGRGAAAATEESPGGEVRAAAGAGPLAAVGGTPELMAHATPVDTDSDMEEGEEREDRPSIPVGSTYGNGVGGSGEVIPGLPSFSPSPGNAAAARRERDAEGTTPAEGTPKMLLPPKPRLLLPPVRGPLLPPRPVVRPAGSGGGGATDRGNNGGGGVAGSYPRVGSAAAPGPSMLLSPPPPRVGGGGAAGLLSPPTPRRPAGPPAVQPPPPPRIDADADADVDAKLLATFEAGTAEALPHPDGTFDVATVAFGVRNFASRPAGLADLARVLSPGGVLGVLEVSAPAPGPAGTAARAFVTAVVPAIGGAAGLLGAVDGAAAAVAGRAAVAERRHGAGAAAGGFDWRAFGAALSAGWTAGVADYTYLANSMMAFPGPPAFTAMLTAAGFGHVRHTRLGPWGLGPDLYVAIKEGVAA